MSDTVKKYHTDLEHKIYPGDIKVHDVSKYYAEDGTDLRDFKNADRAAGNFNEPMIYESPDGGKTITSRPANNPPKKDKYVQQVKKNFEQRSQLGISKYNTTLERTDVDLLGWLTHLQEELMDATLYIERLKDETTKNS